jgi:hypothetical protein
MNTQNMRVDTMNTQELIANNTNIQNMYGEYSYGSESFGSGAQAQAIITIQDITIDGTSCTGGCNIICTVCPAVVDIVVTWANSGDSSGTFTPTVTVDTGSPMLGTTITITSGSTGTTTFSTVSLPRGTPTICFNTGTIT